MSDNGMVVCEKAGECGGYEKYGCMESQPHPEEKHWCKLSRRCRWDGREIRCIPVAVGKEG